MGAMRWRDRTILHLALLPLTLGLFVALPSPAALGQPKPAEKADSKAPRVMRPDRSRDIEFLFGALKAAPDATAAKAVENRIMAIWLTSGSDTADLLMSRVKTAVDQKDLDLALRLLDSLVELRPDYVEAWNRRATLHFMNKAYPESLADIRQVLAREPRHFGALAGLGMILQDIGEEKVALDALRRAIEVHPHLERVREMIEQLTEKVEGRPI
jgi:tetratricopeptide (TPR) repeat protein